MLHAIKNNKSLTFYQPTSLKAKTTFLSSNIGGFYSNSISGSVYSTANISMQYNNQLDNYISALHIERDKIATKVTNGLADNPNYVGARSDGVKLAWKYEQADIDMGGKGSADWNSTEQQEIKETGRVRGAEGHHQKNVADHPKEQGNPDNIKFYKSKQEHLEKGHNGNFRNESDAPMIDKDKMLKKTNTKRVFKNELRGIGIAAAIGAGIGFTIGFAITLAQSGITPDSVKYALAEGGKAGIASGVQSMIGYGIGRTIGQIASKAIEGVLSNVGLTITDNISKMCNMGIVGFITIAVFTAYQFYKLKKMGIGTKEALIKVGKQALFSLSLLAVSIASMCLFGGSAGIIVSIGIGVIIISYSIADTIHKKNISEKIRIYMIEKCKPAFC